MKVKLPSGETTEVATRDDVAKAIGEREGKMSMLNEDVKHLKKVLRTFEKFEAGVVEDDKPAAPPTVPITKTA